MGNTCCKKSTAKVNPYNELQHGSECSSSHTKTDLPYIPPTAEAWVDPMEEFDDIAKYGIVEVSGSDVNGRPVIVVSACKLPPVNQLDHKRFLTYLKVTLDGYVESDYSLVYFHHGLNSSNKPSFTWLLEAYREFDRKYKKNLKNLYIIHPSTIIKLFFNFLKPIISIKFGRKIKYCNYLQDLQDTIPLQQIHIPDDVRRHDSSLMSKNKEKSSDPAQSSEPIALPSTQQFGVSLQFLETNNPGLPVPRVMKETIEYLQTNALNTEGIFRRSPSALELKAIQQKYNLGGSHIEYHDPHLAACTLKAFLRRLPEPLMTYEVYDFVLNITHVEVETRVRVVASILQKLPKHNLQVLKYLMDFLTLVAQNSEINKMNSSNLAVVFGPNLIWSKDQEASLMAMGHINTFVKLLIDYHEQLFSTETDC